MPSGRFSHLQGGSLGNLCSLLANCLVLPPWLIHLSTLPEGHTDPPAKMDFSPRVSGVGESGKTYYGLAFPASWPWGAFLHVSNLSVAPGRGNVWSLDLFFKQHLAPLCSRHDRYGKVSAGGKAWQFAPFLLLFLFWRANASSGAHPSCLRNYKQEATCKCPAWSLPFFHFPRNVNSRPAINA